MAGIGFTMSLFIGELAFSGEPALLDTALLDTAKVAILRASLIAGLGAGWCYGRHLKLPLQLRRFAPDRCVGRRPDPPCSRRWGRLLRTRTLRQGASKRPADGGRILHLDHQPGDGFVAEGDDHHLPATPHVPPHQLTMAADEP